MDAVWTPLKTACRLALVLALVVSTQSLLVVQGAFFLNRAEIARTLCVNADVPEIDCRAMCQLRERMEQMEGHGAPGDSDRGEAVLELALSVRSVVMAESDLPEPPEPRLATRGATALLAPSDGAAGDVFRPPRSA